jgi:hypothetical protein
MLAACAAPIVPQRTKPGGSAMWAVEAAVAKSQTWAADAQMARITGIGVSTDGWLPDHGGTWALEYWSPSKPGMLQVTVDSDGVGQVAGPSGQFASRRKSAGRLARQPEDLGRDAFAPESRSGAHVRC